MKINSNIVVSYESPSSLMTVVPAKMSKPILWFNSAALLVFTILIIPILSGCGQTIRLYSGRELPFHEIAILSVPYSGIILKVDGEVIKWERKEPINVQMLPGSHKIEWSYSNPNITFTYRGRGTLDAKIGEQYQIYFDYLSGEGGFASLSYAVSGQDRGFEQR